MFDWATAFQNLFDAGSALFIFFLWLDSGMLKFKVTRSDDNEKYLRNLVAKMAATQTREWFEIGEKIANIKTWCEAQAQLNTRVSERLNETEKLLGDTETIIGSMLQPTTGDSEVDKAILEASDEIRKLREDAGRYQKIAKLIDRGDPVDMPSLLCDAKAFGEWLNEIEV